MNARALALAGSIIAGAMALLRIGNQILHNAFAFHAPHVEIMPKRCGPENQCTEQERANLSNSGHLPGAQQCADLGCASTSLLNVVCVTTSERVRSIGACVLYSYLGQHFA